MEPEAHVVGGGTGSSLAGSSIPRVSCSLPSAHLIPFVSGGQIEKERRDEQPAHEASKWVNHFLQLQRAGGKLSWHGDPGGGTMED